MSDCCKRPKNPCMVCMRTVTNKTGLQCQGSCKAWIHYACCSYTPGKIKDIKAKIIKVRCPCPDCTPGVPKEELVKEDSFNCLNQKCPVKMKCQKHECPLNKVAQMPSGMCSFTKEWPGMPCGAACKKNSSPTNLSMREPNMGDRRSGSFSPARMSSNGCPPRSSSPAASSACCSPTEPVMPSVSVVENMCETVGMLSNQLNQLMCKMTHALNPKSDKPGSPCYCPQNPRRT